MPPNQPNASKVRKLHGFTITELLVAISIIAILSVLLIATIGKARSKMDQTKCASNLRQLGMAFHMYASENDNILLATGNNDVSIITGSSWSIMLMRYMDFKFPAKNQESLFLCPSALDTYPNGIATRTYAMNWQNLPTEGSDVHPTRGWEQKTLLSWHSNPTETALLIDSRGNVNQAGDGAARYTTSNFDSFADWRHSNGLNVLFLDGHVSWMGRDESDKIKEYTNNFAR